MNTFKKRDRVVIPDGLGVVKHVYDKEGRSISIKVNGNYVFSSLADVRHATSKDFKKGKAEIYKNEKGKWNFRLISKNGQPGAFSNQGYSNRVDMIDVLNNNYLDFEIVRK